MNIIFTLAGLVLFEIVNSIDNAVINAEVLGKMSERAKKLFLTWGIFIGVFAVRGLLPWLILMTAGGLSAKEAFMASFSADPRVVEIIDKTAPILLGGAGIFLIFLFLHWLFLERKEYGLIGEKFIHRHGVWFYALASVILMFVVWKGIHINPMLAFGAVVGSTDFFIIHGFKENAEQAEREILEHGSKGRSDIAMLLYLEAIDACFSIDGVLGAFAFTLSIPLILIGNGIGAIVVRRLTIGNIERVKRYKYLKNGAMYSIAVLGIIMLVDSLGGHIPSWLSPLFTFAIVGYFFWK
ncbi:MAG: hypothetical protein RL094_207 [Candidatus Parcubacteria bacterium]|jgi:hypothetical protein